MPANASRSPNLILFVAFYAAAIYMATRNRLQAHKRLIIVASAAGMGAGFSRVIMFMSGFHPLSIPAGTLGGGLFIIMGMSWDWWTRRAVHPAYLIGLAALILVEVPLLPQVNAEAVDWINQRLAAMGEHRKFAAYPVVHAGVQLHGRSSASRSPWLRAG